MFSGCHVSKSTSYYSLTNHEKKIKRENVCKIDGQNRKVLKRKSINFTNSISIKLPVKNKKDKKDLELPSSSYRIDSEKNSENNAIKITRSSPEKNLPFYTKLEQGGKEEKVSLTHLRGLTNKNIDLKHSLPSVDYSVNSLINQPDTSINHKQYNKNNIQLEKKLTPLVKFILIFLSISLLVLLLFGSANLGLLFYFLFGSWEIGVVAFSALSAASVVLFSKLLKKIFALKSKNKLKTEKRTKSNRNQNIILSILAGGIIVSLIYLIVHGIIEIG